jgi:hypothetical protein
MLGLASACAARRARHVREPARGVEQRGVRDSTRSTEALMRNAIATAILLALIAVLTMAILYGRL